MLGSTALISGSGGVLVFPLARLAVLAGVGMWVTSGGGFAVGGGGLLLR